MRCFNNDGFLGRRKRSRRQWNGNGRNERAAFLIRDVDLHHLLRLTLLLLLLYLLHVESLEAESSLTH